MQGFRLFSSKKDEDKSEGDKKDLPKGFENFLKKKGEPVETAKSDKKDKEAAKAKEQEEEAESELEEDHHDKKENKDEKEKEKEKEK